MRVCNEHRCILLRNSDIWKRYNVGQLHLKKPYTKPRKDPRPDHRKRTALWTQTIVLVDLSYAPDDGRYTVLDAHCTRYADGAVGASGLIDPKEVLIGNTLYVRLTHVNPRCALCDGGDMIPFEMRHFDSRYKPQTRPFPF